MDKRKATLIIVITIAVVLVALAIFYFFFRRQSPATPPDIIFPVGEDLPFGGASTSTPSGSGGFENHPQIFQQKLRLISSLPVSGAVMFDKNNETIIRYIERAKGNIFEVTASKDDAPRRISNTTIPKIYEALWAQNGQGVVLRYLKEGTDDIQTYYASLRAGTSTEQTLADGTFLPNNIKIVTVSPAQDKIFYLVNTGDGSSGVRANPNGTGRSQIFSSPAQEWLASWPRANTIMLSTKPSGTVPGILYSLDATSGTLRKILGGVNGLTANTNSDGTQILFSESDLSAFSLKLLSTVDQKTSQIGLITLPEKCVWSKTQKETFYCAVPDNIPVANYPDDWYQGEVSFADNIWKINTKTGQTEMLVSPQSVARTTMDIIDLNLSENEGYLLFKNKKDLSLWLLILNTTP